MSAVYGPQEATTTDVKAALSRLDSAIQAGNGDAAAALEDAENTSLSDYRAMLRDPEARAEPEAIQGPAAATERDITFAWRSAERAADAAVVAPGDPEANETARAAFGTFTAANRSAERSGPDREAGQ